MSQNHVIYREAKKYLCGDIWNYHILPHLVTYKAHCRHCRKYKSQWNPCNHSFDEKIFYRRFYNNDLFYRSANQTHTFIGDALKIWKFIDTEQSKFYRPYNKDDLMTEIHNRYRIPSMEKLYLGIDTKYIDRTGPCMFEWSLINDYYTEISYNYHVIKTINETQLIEKLSLPSPHHKKIIRNWYCCITYMTVINRGLIDPLLDGSNIGTYQLKLTRDFTLVPYK